MSDAKKSGQNTGQNHKKEIDKITGVETTGHEWDGLKELNNPAPRWWLWVFYVCIAWSVAFWILYPSWPTLSGSTKGILGWTKYKKLEAQQAVITARQNVYLTRFEKASFDKILNDPELYKFAVAAGHATFKDNCATCHGTGGAGGKGYPNLNDDDWLWGGMIGDIYQTIRYGINSGHDEARSSQMPAFGDDELLEKEEINAVVDYVLSLSGGKDAPEESVSAGKDIFAENCSSCHGEDAKGSHEIGAPNLTDSIWLYGGDRETVLKTVNSGRSGLMPAWVQRLDDNTIRELAVYVHELGGGQTAKSESLESQTDAQAQADKTSDGAGDEENSVKASDNVTEEPVKSSAEGENADSDDNAPVQETDKEADKAE